MHTCHSTHIHISHIGIHIFINVCEWIECGFCGLRVVYKIGIDAWLRRNSQYDRGDSMRKTTKYWVERLHHRATGKDLSLPAVQPIQIYVYINIYVYTRIWYNNRMCWLPFHARCVIGACSVAGTSSIIGRAVVIVYAAAIHANFIIVSLMTAMIHAHFHIDFLFSLSRSHESASIFVRSFWRIFLIDKKVWNFSQKIICVLG